MMCVTLTSYQGYQGMVDGGANIYEANWKSVSGIMQQVVRGRVDIATKQVGGRHSASTRDERS